MERINRCSYIKLYFSRARLFCWSVNHYNDILIIFQKRGKRQIICINGGFSVSSNGPNEGESGSAWGSLTGPVGPVGSLSSTSFERQKPTRRLDGSASLSNGIHCLICFYLRLQKGGKARYPAKFSPPAFPLYLTTSTLKARGVPRIFLAPYFVKLKCACGPSCSMIQFSLA